MLLEISTTYVPATDLGYLLHKHPDRFQSFRMACGQVHIFYPEAGNERATMCLLLDIDPVKLVRGGSKGVRGGFTLRQYVNDRPYVAGSFMSAAIAQSLSTALNGTCSGRPELARQILPLQARVTVVSAPAGGESLIRRFFDPLGYQVTLTGVELDSQFPEWGTSPYFTLELSHRITLREMLAHLYVLLPALDQHKHYYVSESEVDKLLQKGEGWLEEHPARDQIVRRYLQHFKDLTGSAFRQLLEKEGGIGPEHGTKISTDQPRKMTLHEKRLDAVTEKLLESGARKVLDLGCGEGKLLKKLAPHNQFQKITGVDVSYQALLRAQDRLKWSRMTPVERERFQLFQGALTYRDKRFDGYDAAALVEVIEHLDEDRLNAMERSVFEFSRPGTVIITTPNREYNVLFESMSAAHMRHNDHRFEWTRAEFESWANRVAAVYRYKVTFYPIGEEEPVVGPPSQMAIFKYGN